MIQFNLLPDLKLQYVKAERLKRQVTLITTVLSVVAIAALAFAFVMVNVVQKKSLSDLNKDIKTYSTQLRSVQDLSSILTIQNQLDTLPQLHDNKPVASRLFTFINQLTPAQTSLSRINVSFLASTITLSGEAPSLDVVNTYTDTLKATTYKSNGTDTKAFNSIVLSSFGRNATGATYTIDLKFDPLIFDSRQAVSLTVPAGPTADPAALFQKQAGS